jgi:hypothetical protein
MRNNSFGITGGKLDITFSDLGTAHLFKFLENAGYGGKND